MKNPHQFNKIYFKLIEQKNLTSSEMSLIMKLLSEGEINPVQSSAILTSLTIKGETYEEIYGAVKTLKNKAIPIKKKFNGPTMDTCGTGGDKKNTFNISTLVAIILASLGLKISKHGNRSITSNCGSADLLESLGVNVAMSPEKIADCLNQIGIAFLFAPNLHPAFKHIMPIRKSLGFKTIFNALGPLLNPVKLDYQVVGVFDKKYVGAYAKTLQKMGVTRGAVFHAEDGMDEISLASASYLATFDKKKIGFSKFNPEKYGFKLCRMGDLESKTLSSNKKIALNILSGKEQGPKRDIVILNAGLAYRIYYPNTPFKKAFKVIDNVISQGTALKKLEELVNFSNH